MNETHPAARIDSLRVVHSAEDSRLRIAAIGFLNPAPLMWDFEHEPLDSELARRYSIERMTPSECAARLADGRADLGLVPIAALATTPGLRILPGCTIASKDYVRSLVLVRRAAMPLAAIRTVAADTASQTTIAYSRILFRMWGNPAAEFMPMTSDLDAMLEHADAAIVIGDPALLALEERFNREVRSGEELVYHDLAHEWRAMTGLTFVSAVWCSSPHRGSAIDESVDEDMIRSRDHGLRHIDEIATEWAGRIPMTEETIRSYLANNIHYVLDDECLDGMKGFFRIAAENGILPEYALNVEALTPR